MPPPPSPLSHRRSHRLVKPSLDLPSCLSPKMSLQKGNTFHASSSLPTDDDPILSIHHLSRRSPTCSQSMLASWLSDKTDVTQSLRDFDETFSGARGRRSSTRRRSNDQQVKVRRGSISSDEGIGGSVVSSASDKSLSRKFERALDLLEKDSGLGSSVGDRTSVSAEEEGSSAKDLVQGWLVRCLLMCSCGSNNPLTVTNTSAPASRPRRRIPTTSAVTQSVAPPETSTRQPLLSSFARKKINKYIIAPILREERFEDFHPLVSSLGLKSNKVRCLRDVERSLIFQPLVSTVLSGLSSPSDTISTKTFDITPQEYRAFGEFSVQLVLDTYQQLPETEQRRAADRPYDNGYFLDLVQQVGRLAAQIGHAREQGETTEEATATFESIYDEVTLEGGLSTTGDMAELVGWKDGKATSLRTGEEYTPVPGIKRGASSMHDEDVARSMARRKKGVLPEIIEMHCSDPTCDKVFTRKCDLAKHEKTHSRPFKCPHDDCKYHDLGLPTEKERDRHINDKHDPNPHFYQCTFCEFRTKRESNCKQHMEKKHGWQYERAKGKDKDRPVTSRMTPAQTPQTPALDYNSSMQSPAMSYVSTWDDSRSRSMSIAGPSSITHSAQVTPYEQPLNAFDNGYGLAPTNSAIFPRNDAYQQSTFDFNTFQPGQSYISPVSSHRNMTPATPAYSNITGQSPFSAHMDVAMDFNNNCNYDNQYNSMPTPESFMQPGSRQTSMSIPNQSPMFDDMEQSNMYDAGDVMFDPLISGNNAPDHDFALFSGADGMNTSPFSNPAAAQATLFPTQTASQFTAAVESNLIDEILSESEASFDFMAN
jgi:hypothetical protein